MSIVFEARNARELLLSLIFGLSQEKKFSIVNLSNIAIPVFLLEDISLLNIKYLTFLDKLKYQFFFNIKMNDVEDVYVFHESSPLARVKACRVHLIEHGYINYFENKEIISRMSFFSKLLTKAFYQGLSGGRSSYVQDVFFTAPEAAPKDLQHKAEELMMLEKWRNIPERLQEKVYRFFNFSPLKRQSIVLLTQPLEVFKGYSESDKIELYRRVLYSYSDSHVVIKPHPHEKTLYSEFFPNVEVLRGDFPVELLILNQDKCIDEVVTLFSSAVFSFVGECKVTWLSTCNDAKLQSVTGDLVLPLAFNSLVDYREIL